MKSKNKTTLFAYLGIIAVVLIWGVIPTFKKALIGGHFSAAIYSAITTGAGAIALLILFAKDLKKINLSYRTSTALREARAFRYRDRS